MQFYLKGKIFVFNKSVQISALPIHAHVVPEKKVNILIVGEPADEMATPWDYCVVMIFNLKYKHVFVISVFILALSTTIYCIIS